MWQDITEKEKSEFNQLATHPLQSFEWGQFRKSSGIKVIRKGLSEKGKLIQAFQLTIHPLPHIPFTIGYLPKGTLPTPKLLEELTTIGKAEKCIFIQLEPNVPNIHDSRGGTTGPDEGGRLLDKRGQRSDRTLVDSEMTNLGLTPSAHPLFTKHTLQLDLTLSEEDLLKAMHQKARYNIKVAQKHGVVVAEEDTQKGFDTFWKLTQETTSRQQFFAHTATYHKLQWQTLPHSLQKDTLSSHLLIARYQGQPLTAWILFVFKDMLYYPYGASSNEHRETMHSTLMMWEAIRFGKKNKLKAFDLWGSAAPGTPPSDPWFGFTQFKERFGPERVEFIGSFDLVIHPLLYQAYKMADKLRWTLLKLKK